MAEGGTTIRGAKTDVFDAEKYVNNPEIELAWADKAVEHMEVHFNLITSIDPMILKLTPYDDEIYETFKKCFPDFKLDVLEEASLKSKESKEKWRDFCNIFKDKVEDALYGTLVRTDCSGPYTEENTILVVRVQFLAIEIARNRSGFNNKVYEEHKKEIKL